jgi:hypothetical protein
MTSTVSADYESVSMHLTGVSTDSDSQYSSYDIPSGVYVSYSLETWAYNTIQGGWSWARAYITNCGECYSYVSGEPGYDSCSDSGVFYSGSGGTYIVVAECAHSPGGYCHAEASLSW